MLQRKIFKFTKDSKRIYLNILLLEDLFLEKVKKESGLKVGFGYNQFLVTHFVKFKN